MMDSKNSNQYDINKEELNHLVELLNKDYYAIFDSKEYIWGRKFLKGLDALTHMKVKMLYKAFLYKKAQKKVDALGKVKLRREIKKVSLRNNHRVAIYTSVIGDYDKLLEPYIAASNIDYYVITDGNITSDSLWKQININDFPETLKLDATRKNRYFKMHPDIVFPDYEYSIYVDGHVSILGNLSEYIDAINNTGLAMYEHPSRVCLYDEAKACIYLKKDARLKIMEQTKSYKLEGMPEGFGLCECTVIVREHHNDICKRIMDIWWNELLTKSKRDQISFPYSVWKAGYEMNQIGYLGNNLRRDALFRVVNHSGMLY